MKLIIVMDCDAHVNAFSFTDENMRKCLQHLIDIRYDMLGNIAPQLAKTGTADEIESFLRSWNGPVERSGGNGLNFVEVKDEWDYCCGPFE